MEWKEKVGRGNKERKGQPRMKKNDRLRSLIGYHYVI